MTELTEKQRSSAQNKSGHKYFTDAAAELEAQGVNRKTIVEDLGDWGAPITDMFLKYVVWHHFMVSMYGKESTTELTTKEWTEVEKNFTHFLKERYGLQTDYPSEESRQFNEWYGQ